MKIVCPVCGDVIEDMDKRYEVLDYTPLELRTQIAKDIEPCYKCRPAEQEQEEVDT